MFAVDSYGWTAGFANYPVDFHDQMQLEAQRTLLPHELAPEGRRGLYTAATNHSDDVFMFWKGQVHGFEPGEVYQLQFQVELATKAPAGCFGIGGAPGEAVYVKVGAAGQEPKPVLTDFGGSDYWIMNIDKGNQSEGGNDALVIGDIASPEAGECEDPVWVTKTLASEEPLPVNAAEDGTLWFLVGTDSGFEGRTELYYSRFRAWVYEP